MTFNKELALETLDAIRKDQEHWYQGDWRTDLKKITDGERCGTGMCFAGFAVTVDGCRWAFPNGHEHRDMLLARKSDPEECVHMVGGKRVISASTRAQLLLGITNNQAAYLFDPGNDLTDLKRYIDKFAKETP